MRRRRIWVGLLDDDERGVLGDLYYTADEVARAQGQITRLVNFWTTQGKPSQFGAAVSSVLTRAKALADSGDLSGPTAMLAGGGWSRLVALGQEAEELTTRIARATGAEVPPTLSQKDTSSISSIVDTLTTLGLVGAAVYLGSKVLEWRRSRREPA